MRSKWHLNPDGSQGGGWFDTDFLLRQGFALNYDSNGQLSSVTTPSGNTVLSAQTLNEVATVNVSADGDSGDVPVTPVLVGGMVPAPNKGPSYTHADVCAASAVLNKGLPTLLDALGMIPGEGTLLKGLQWGASILSGTMIDNPGDAALSGGGLGLMALDSGLKSQGREVTAKVFGKTVGVLPIAGILTSGYATYRDVYGTNGMNAYYDNCLAGKN